jgi:DNA polymerase-1
MAWNIDAPTAQYVGHQTPAHEIQRIVTEVYHSPVVAIDTETTGLVKWRDVPLYFSLAWGNQRATLHADMLPHFIPCFGNPDITWPLANAKYDMHILANYGYSILGKWHDVQVMHALMFDDKPHKLKYIAQHILGWTWAGFQDQFGKICAAQSPKQLIEKAERENMAVLIEYAANDAWGTLRSYFALKEMLEREKTYSLFQRHPPYIETLWDFFSKIESPYTKALWKMERRGVKIDRQRFLAARPEAEEKIKEIRREIVHLAGEPINPNSTKQLAAYAEKQKIPPIKWTKGGKTGERKPSWDSTVLEHYEHEVPLFKLMLEEREYSKLLGTYIIGLNEIVDPNDRIHANYNQAVARTGRLSCSDPNLQNLPRAENDEWNLRGAFITEPGWSLLCADYQQLEMRLLACAAQEQSMVDVFLRGWDIHAGNAALMFNNSKDYEDINEAKDLLKKLKKCSTPGETIDAAESKLPGVLARASDRQMTLDGYLRQCAFWRTAAKAVGFGLNYGMGPNKLAGDIGCTVSEAKDKIAQYKGTYPAVEHFMKEAIEEGKKYGFAFTVMGRRRNIPMIGSSSKAEQARGERLAVNTQIQGSAADVTRAAQTNIDCIGLDRFFDCHCVLQVHDELVYEVPDEHADECLREIEDAMAHPFSIDLLCPLPADGGRGKSWAEAK